MVDLEFPPTRAAALDRLAAFLPEAGARYEAMRNTDGGPARATTSRLSPFLRHRLLTEQEVVERVLQSHGRAASAKFVQEVLWRTYWKGWLELRPAVWSRFVAARDEHLRSLRDPRALREGEEGRTGIEGFDDWARELVAHGYLHNHARMWFASIWIFTLRLPWELGADFFLRHLVDADPASNTLSWRWVAGLQTAGKTYLATAENIARFTNGRFSPHGLACEATALTEPPVPAAGKLPLSESVQGDAPALLLVTPEDMNPESLFASPGSFRAVVVAREEPSLRGAHARAFVGEAVADTAARAAARYGAPATCVASLDAETILRAASAASVRRVVTPYAPVGPVADAVSALEAALAREGIALARVRRRWDDALWPHALRGFFPFREKAPSLVAGLIGR